jgi:hypothetical protein
VAALAAVALVPAALVASPSDARPSRPLATTAPASTIRPTQAPTLTPAPDRAVLAAARSARNELAAALAAQRAELSKARRLFELDQPTRLPATRSSAATEQVDGATRVAANPAHPLKHGTPGSHAPTLAAALAPGVGVNFADYAYRTIYTPTSGPPVVEFTEAVLGSPTPINVTGSGGAQFTGSITPTTASTPAGITLTIQRVATMPAGDKVSIEAILLVPGSPETYLGFGEDGSSAGTAQTWSATVGVASYSASSVELGLSPVAATAPPASLGVLGELFSGPHPGAPTNLSRGDVSFDPVPPTVSTTITLEPSKLQVALTGSSSSPSFVTALVTARSPGQVQLVETRIGKLAASAALGFDTTGGEQALSYTGSAPLRRFDLSYHRFDGGVLLDASAIAASAVPTGMSVTEQSAAPQLAFTATGGAVGSLQLRYSHGASLPPVPSGTGNYVSSQRSASTSRLGARLSGLLSLVLGTGQPFSLDLQTSTPLPSVALVSEDSTDGLTLRSALIGLPAHTTISLDLTTSPKAGLLAFDGHGSGIGKFLLDATQTPSFYGRVTTMQAAVTAIPATETLGFSKTESSFIADASVPLGVLSLLLSDGEGPPGVTGSAIDYLDSAKHFRAYLSLLGFSSVVLGSTSGTPIAAHVATSETQDLALRAQSAEGTFTGSIDQLPTALDFALTLDTLGDQVFTMGCSAPVASVSLEGSGVKLPVPARNLALDLSHVPTKLLLALPGPGRGASFGANGPIREIKAQAWQSGAVLGTSPDSFLYNDRPDHYRVALDVDGLEKLAVQPPGTTTPLTASVTTAGGSKRDFTVTLLLDGETNRYAAISCPSPRQCTASIGSGQLVTFDPQRPSGPTRTARLADGASVTALACPSPTQCTAVVPSLRDGGVPDIGRNTGTVGVGGEVTFDPATASLLRPTVIDPNEPFTVLSCPSVHLCVAVDADQEMFTFDPTSPLSSRRSNGAKDAKLGATTGLSCPSTTQCTAITDFTSTSPFATTYQEYTVDPRTFAFVGAGAVPFVEGRTMDVVDCPSTSQCTIADNTGTEYRLVPRVNPVDINSGAPLLSIPIELANPTALSCPTTDECNEISGVSEETFNPRTGASPYPTDLLTTLLSISCPSDSQCTTLDDAGHEITFDPHRLKMVGNRAEGVTSDTLIGSLWEITSRIDHLPSTMSLTVTPSSGGGLSVQYDGSSPIPRLTLDAGGLPISQDVSNIHVEVDKIPTGMSLQIPATGGEIVFSPCAHPANCPGGSVGSILAEVFGEKPEALPVSSDQGIAYDLDTGEATALLDDVGSFSVNESGLPLDLDYNIASTPLDVDVTLGRLLDPDGPTASNPGAIASYLDARISSPAHATTISLSTSSGSANGIYLDYSAGAPIGSIRLDTNSGDNYFQGTLLHLPQKLTICADTTANGSPCSLYCPSGDLFGPTIYKSECVDLPVPQGWIPDWTGAGWTCYGFGTETAPCPGPSTGYEIFHNSDLWFELLPTDASGHPPSTPMTIDVLDCPGASAHECIDDSPVNKVPGQYPYTLFVDQLRFSTLEIAVGSGTNGGESYAWLGFDTDPKFGLRVQQVSLWGLGQQTISTSPSIQITNTAGGKGGLIANRFLLFGEQNGSEVKVYTTDVGKPGSPGSWTCINPLNLEIAGEDVAPLFGCG